MLGLIQRSKIVDRFEVDIKSQFPQVDQYNVLIFGSFLTEKFHESSDIDVGIFTLDNRLMNQLFLFVLDYFKGLDIPCDVVRMYLDYDRYINTNIILYHNRALTEYCPNELVQYTKKMIDLYGQNPMDTVRQRIVQEVALHDFDRRCPRRNGCSKCIE